MAAYVAESAPSLRASGNPRRLGDRRTARAVHYAMLCPTLLLLLAFLVVPAVYVGWLSFNTSTYGQDLQFVGWASILVS